MQISQIPITVFVYQDFASVDVLAIGYFDKISDLRHPSELNTCTIESHSILFSCDLCKYCIGIDLFLAQEKQN